MTMKNGGLDNPAFENDLQLVEINGKGHDGAEKDQHAVKGFECDDHRVPLEELLERYHTHDQKVKMSNLIFVERLYYC